MNSKLKRGVLTAIASGAAAVASLAVLPASPAFAYTPSCLTYSLSQGSFKVCVVQTSSTAAKAYVTVASNSTYISGKLVIVTPSGSYSSCSGKYYSGDTCSITKSHGSGTYRSAWNSVSGSTYEGGAVRV
ncbi:hypothetical protein FHX34_1011742 [Actinoplanes teichomyceticus]|uniref:Uncharacterized protein n=1 Tax=Actinoplanes teichomyceticus TaxID=1867 RepID=A0A561WSC7_ACTTI|nr:hypothetical protein FHX34_1011742 [Actinoplanes teichomyceticus]